MSKARSHGPQYATKAAAGVPREKKTTVIEAETKRIYATHGYIDAELLLHESSKPNAPLFKYFNWDDASAAYKYRLQQATNMLLASKFVVMLARRDKNSLPTAVSAKPTQLREWLSPFRGEGYKMRKEVINDAEMRNAMVARKLQSLRSWCDEASDFPELKKIRRSLLRLLPP